MLSDHGGELEPVQLGHADVNEDHRSLVLEQVFESLPAGGGNGEIFAELLQDNLVGQQFCRLIVNQKDVYFFVVHHPAHQSTM